MLGSERARNALSVAIACAVALAFVACDSSSDDGSSSGAKQTPDAKQSDTSSKYSWRDVSGDSAAPKLLGDQVSVDVGNGHVLSWTKGDPLKIAFFQQGQSNIYLQANTKGARDRAKELGVQLTVFDAEFKPTTQKSQIQNALASGRYNAAIVLPVDSPGSCKALTGDIPKVGLPVVVIAQQTCGRDDKSGSELWSPGTVSWIGHDYPAYYKAWTDAVARTLTSKGEAIMIGGPQGNAPSNAAESAAKRTATEYPNMKLVDVARTDYTTAQALTSTQNLLQAHPDVSVVLVQYGGQVPGVIQALKQSGKAGKVKIYDAGGSAIEKGFVESGSLEMTVPLYPYTQSACAVDMLAALFKGERVPRVVLNDCHETEGSPDTENPVILTKDNVAEFTPEY